MIYCRILLLFWSVSFEVDLWLGHLKMWHIGEKNGWKWSVTFEPLQIWLIPGIDTLKKITSLNCTSRLETKCDVKTSSFSCLNDYTQLELLLRYKVYGSAPHAPNLVDLYVSFIQICLYIPLYSALVDLWLFYPTHLWLIYYFLMMKHDISFVLLSRHQKSTHMTTCEWSLVVNLVRSMGN